MDNLLLILGAILLVFINGYFVALEFSLVKLRPTRIKSIQQSAGWRGQVLAKVHADLDAYLSACQLGITLASLGLGWVGEPAFAGLLKPVFLMLEITSIELIHTISFTFAFCTISFLHIVVGEQAPKSMAIRNPEAIGLWGAGLLYLLYWVMYPAIWLLNGSANLVLRLAGLKEHHGHESHYSTEEIQLILRAGRPGGTFSNQEWKLLAKALDFSKLQASELMRPFHEITALYRSNTVRENLAIVLDSRFSRYPYLDSNGTDVVGVIYLKDLFVASQSPETDIDLEQYLRPIRYVPSHQPAVELFRVFSQGAPHFALVGQKGQKPRGFITMDNLLSALVGEMQDEFRPSETGWQLQDDGSWLGKGSLPSFALERLLDIDIENEQLDLENVDSVGGLILAKLCDIPEQNEKVLFDAFDVTIFKMDGPRIEWVKVNRKPEYIAELLTIDGPS
ncbi:MAG: hemolysin family protein [Methylomonas sp.]|jgi:CBS domain containing-hemolysin-like protein|uniref:hemolysin family protein n=1 Tax=Methylomonas sp. TaxID=418 RepID=UPI0025D23B11|nr:hemolysin family protein [Methylomonas sp.]MCK9605053.1 hemolysin family protein [Methylomonas sp.]